MKWKVFNPPVEELTWLEARSSFAQADPSISKIIDDISPDNSFKLIRIRYPYGAIIYELGKFFVPTTEGDILTLDHAKVPLFIREALSYSSVPLGCITSNSFEAFKQVGDHISPVSHRKTGLDLGIWEAFMPASPFTVTAGSRSVFMLPKITDTNGHKKLKKIWG